MCWRSCLKRPIRSNEVGAVMMHPIIKTYKGIDVKSITEKVYEVEVIDAIPGAITVDQLKAYIEPFLKAQDVSTRTLGAYGKNITYFFKWAVDRVEGVSGREDIIAYKTHLIDRKLQNTTVNAYLTTVRRFYSWLYDKDVIKKDYAKTVKSVSVTPGHKKDPLTDDQFRQVLATIDLDTELGKRDYLMLLLGVQVGTRGIEISRLDKGDIVMVKDTWALMLWRKGHEEGDKQPFPIHTDLAHLLLDYVKDDEEGDPIFKSLSNNASRMDCRRVSVAGVRYAITKRFQEAGIKTKRLTLHSLRHTFGVELFKLDTPLLTICSLMGHKSVETTTVYLKSISMFDNPASLKLNKMYLN